MDTYSNISPSNSPYSRQLHSGNFQQQKTEYLFKVLVIGDIGTGKTSVIKRYVHDLFSDRYRATIGVDFALKVLQWDDESVVRLQLWDIAGQERFGNMTRVYYKEASGAFIVFDVSRAATFEGVTKWKADLDAKVRLADGRQLPCVLLANKCDLEKAVSVAKPQEFQDYCNRHGFVGWFETSAKENVGIEDAANTLIDQIMTIQKAGQYEIPVVERDLDVQRLLDAKEEQKKKSKARKCCT